MEALKAADDQRQKANQANEALAEAVSSGQVTTSEAADKVVQVDDRANSRTKNERWHATKHARMYGWRKRSCGDKPHAYTAQNHPSNKAIVQYVYWFSTLLFCPLSLRDERSRYIRSWAENLSSCTLQDQA